VAGVVVEVVEAPSRG